MPNLAHVVARGLGLLALASTASPQSGPIAATGGGIQLTFEELDPVLVDRWAMAEEGRAAIAHIMKVRVIEQAAYDVGMIVTDAELAQRWAEVDRAARAQGLEGGMLEELEANGLTLDDFRALLRTSMYHERLTRDALGLADDAEVTAEMQEIWIEDRLLKAGFEAPAPPWKDGIAARCGSIEVDANEYQKLLRTQLPVDNVRELCFQMLLKKGLESYAERRLPDLSDEARSAAIDREIERRRKDVASDPRYQGVDLESVLRAQGMRVETLDRDPAVVVASLATVLVDRLWGEDGMRGVYEAERQHFENRYGEAVLTRLLFIGGVPHENQLQPRSLEAAMALCDSLAAKIQSEADFIELVEEFSEDAPTQAQKGALGWVTREGEGVPAPVREQIFLPLESGKGLAKNGQLSGPHTLLSPSGAYLLWLSESRPSPSWDAMRVHVHRELRARLMEEVVPRRGTVTFLDPQ